MPKISYCFYKYAILDELEEPIGPNKHVEIIHGIAGQKVAHRKPDPSPSDRDTFIMRFREEVLTGQECAIFDVAKSIDFRVEHRYNPVSDDLDLVDVVADDTIWTHLVMVPEMERIGIRDGSGELLSADQGANRVRSVIRGLTTLDFSYERTATSGEVAQAARRLGLTEFTFTARPTNPDPSRPGELMDALLKKARVGKITAKTEPAYGDTLSVADEGLVSEAIGLASDGYGQYGFKGTTGTGAEVAYKKPKYEGTKEGNLKQQAKPSSLKVLVPSDDARASEEEHVVNTMLEIYGG